MAVRRRDLLTEQKQVEIEMTQGTLTVTYKPALWTSRIKQEAMSATSNEDAFALISRAIVEWDYLDDDDKPFPIDVATFMDMPDGMPMQLFIGLSGGLPNASDGSSTTPSGGEEADDD
jgi:hypothetical protein